MLETLTADVLTDVLRSLRLRIGLLGRGDYCGRWALDFGGFDKPVFHLVGRGPFWLHCRSLPEPFELGEGDLVFFPRCQWHQFSGTPECHEETAIITPAEAEGPIHTLVCFSVDFESQAFNPLLASLPPLLIVNCRTERVSAELLALTRLMLSQYEGTTPGYEAMRERLAEVLLIQLLRHHMTNASGLQGLLSALKDPRLAHTLSALHADPARDWNVDRLAAEAGMSRSTFARRFAECLGSSPMDYLCEWRMHLAEQMLHERHRSVAQVAEAVGYKTEAAFRHAFKRLRGVGPGEVRRATPVKSSPA